MGARLVGTLLVVISLASVASAQPAATPPPIEQAIAEAAKVGKPLVVLVSTSWCGPCKEFKKKVLPDPKVQAALAAVSFVEYDAEVAPGDEAARRFDASGYPTFVAVDAQGVVRERHQGAPVDAAAFVKWIEAAHAATEEERSVQLRVARAPTDVKTRLSAARWYERRRMYAEAIAHYDAVVKQRGVPSADAAIARKGAGRLRRLVTWRQQLVDEKIAELRFDPATADLDALSIATIDSGLTLRDVRKLVADVLPARTVPGDLNHAVYIALAAGAYDEALVAAKRLVALQRVPQYLDTLAECEHMKGNKQEALKLIDEALAQKPPAAMKDVLDENRRRFAASVLESAELEPYRERVEKMWSSFERIDVLPRRSVSNATADARLKEMMARREAVRTLAVATEARCRGKTGSTRYADALLDVDASGAVTSVVLLLEPKAPAALRTCLEQAVTHHTLPPAKHSSGREHLHLDFGPNKLP